MNRKKQIALFLAATILLAASGGINESIFNNFLDGVHELGPEARGWLEFPRELPGLLVVLMTGLLAALPVTRLGLVGAGVQAAGLIGLGLWGGWYTPMLGMMVIASAGMHLLQPVGSSIAIGLSDEGNKGRRLGYFGALGTLGFILGSGMVWLLFRGESPPYGAGFVGAGLLALAGAVFFFFMDMPSLHQKRVPWVVKRKFRLYYALEFLFGARKQVFLTFGPWVLIRVYGAHVSDIAWLLFIASLHGLWFRPVAGWAIDRFGERTILILDALVLSLVCVGYGYAGAIMPTASGALWLAGTCFVLDQLLFALGSGRTIYVSRLTESPQELTSTLSVGISVNHAVSMTIPAVAGAVWAGFGYQKVFLAAGVLALVMAFMCTYLPGKVRI